jgi:hypothetical protein
MAEGVSSGAASPAGAAAAAAGAPENDNPTTRVLRRGDLVKVLERWVKCVDAVSTAA